MTDTGTHRWYKRGLTKLLELVQSHGLTKHSVLWENTVLSLQLPAVLHKSFWRNNEKRARKAVPKIGPLYGTIFWQQGAVTALFRATSRCLLRRRMWHTIPAEVMHRRGRISSTRVAFFSQGLGRKMGPFRVPESGPQIEPGFRPPPIIRL